MRAARGSVGATAAAAAITCMLRGRRWCSNSHPSFLAPLWKHSRQSKIRQLELASMSHHIIQALDVSMNETVLVQVHERARALHTEIQDGMVAPTRMEFDTW